MSLGKGKEEDWKGALGLNKSHSAFTSSPGEQGFKVEDQEVRPRGLVSSKDNEFSQEDKMFIKAELAEYFIQVAIWSWELCPNDNTAVSSLKQVT